MASQKGHGPLPVGHVCQPTANQPLRPLHDRMPVILAPETYSAWLGEDGAAAPELLALLTPYPPDAHARLSGEHGGQQPEER